MELNNSNNTNNNNNYSSSSNNNNNNDDFTQLFYKVIHNKYLFYKIIQQIHIVDWVKYNSVDQIKYNNRIKFKNIQSVRWMIDNQQIELLKNKIIEGDPVDFDKAPLNYISEIKEANNRILVFKLILESKSISNKDKLIYDSLHLLSPELLSIALDPPYSIPILESTIERTIMESSLEQINIIYNHLYNKLINSSNNSNPKKRLRVDSNNNNKQDNSTNNINNNNNNNNNNNSVYSKDNIQLILSFIEELFGLLIDTKDIFQTDKILSNIFNNNNHPSTSTTIIAPPSPPIYSLISIPKIDIDTIIFKIISTNTQIILLDNNLYSIPNYLKQYNNDINNIINNNNNQNKIIKLRNYIRPIINLIIYNEIPSLPQPLSPPSLPASSDYSGVPISDMEFELEIIESTFNPSLLELDNLKLVLNNNKYNWKGFNFNIEYKDSGFMRNVSLEYIKYYIELDGYEEFRYFKVGAIEKIINREISNILFNASKGLKDKSILQDLINYARSIPNENKRASSILMVKFIKGLTIQDGELIIMDGETAELYNSNFSPNYNVQYKDIEMVINLKDKKGLSISQCIKIIKDSIVSINNDQFRKVMGIFGEDKPCNINASGEFHTCSLKDLFRYGRESILSGIGHYSKLKLFEYLIKKQCLDSINSCLGLFLNEDEAFKSNFIKNWFSYLITREYSELRSKVIINLFKYHGSNSGILKLWLSNGFNPSESNDHYMELSQLWYECNFTLFHVNPSNAIVLNYNLQDTFDQLFNCIKLLLDYCDSSSSSSKEQEEEEEEEEEKVMNGKNELINELFRRIVTNKTTTSDQVLAAYKLINSSRSARVDSNSTYLSIYYLSIKSIKLIKYILESPLLDVYRQNNSNALLSFPFLLAKTNDIDINNEKYLQEEICKHFINFIDYIHPSLFSIGFIFNNSFDTVLNQLINHCSYIVVDKSLENKLNSIDDNNSSLLDIKINKSLNYNLEYFMDINRHDLVLQHLEIIKSKYSDHYNSTQYQFSSKFIQQCIYKDFITPLLDNSSKLIKFPTPPYNQSLNINTINQIINNINLNNNNNNNNNSK